MGNQKSVSVLGPGIISGLSIYLPIPLVRGAVFGLFSGLVKRSVRTSLLGAGFGALLDLAYVFLWQGLAGRIFDIAWNTHLPFNEMLVLWLPISFRLVPASGSPYPNNVQFVLSIMAWHVCMILGWLFLWRPRLHLGKCSLILLVAAICSIVAGSAMWAIAPLTISPPGPQTSLERSLDTDAHKASCQ
ncbi:MAG: hypothetical protein ACYSR6_14840 [Planctomycetota bacterium]|jgi:hypothetical protein